MNSLESFGQHAHRLGPLGEDVEKLLLVLARAKGVGVHSVTNRVKSESSVQRKLLDKKSGSNSINSLTDLLGLRVITYFPDEVDQIAELIESEFLVDLDNSIDKRKVLDPDRFGYLSLHYVASIGESRQNLPDWLPYKDVKFEIQIRSILQHAWAEIEHDLGYKSANRVPSEIRRRFSRLAGLLEIADAEFTSIRNQLAEYGEEVELAVREGEEVEIDQVTLAAFIEQSPTVLRLDRIIAEGTGTSLTPATQEYAGRRAEELQKLHLPGLNVVRDLLERDGEQVAKFAIAWVNLPEGDFGHERNNENIDPATGKYLLLSRGISIFYLYMHLALESGDPSMVPHVGNPEVWNDDHPSLLDVHAAAGRA